MCLTPQTLILERAITTRRTFKRGFASMKKERTVKHATTLPSGRRIVLAVLLATAVALALVVATGVSAGKASAASRRVTKSFSKDTQITIPGPYTISGPAFPYPSNITSSFPKGSKVRDVNVVLRNYTHGFPDDVDVLLAHGGKNRTIMSDVGRGFDVTNITLKLDDEASGHLPDESQLVGGVFKPTNSGAIDRFAVPAPNPASPKSALSGFDGLGARGKWKLFVMDDEPFDFGKFAGGWTIQIRAAVPHSRRG